MGVNSNIRQYRKESDIAGNSFNIPKETDHCHAGL